MFLSVKYIVFNFKVMEVFQSLVKLDLKPLETNPFDFRVRVRYDSSNGQKSLED
jgi:hypothetical protein